MCLISVNFVSFCDVNTFAPERSCKVSNSGFVGLVNCKNTLLAFARVGSEPTNPRKKQTLRSGVRMIAAAVRGLLVALESILISKAVRRPQVHPGVLDFVV